MKRDAKTKKQWSKPASRGMQNNTRNQQNRNWVRRKLARMGVVSKDSIRRHK